MRLIKKISDKVEVSFAGESILGLVLRLFQCFKYAYQYLVSFVCFYELLDRGRTSRQEVSCEKSVLRNLAKLIGKPLCQSLYFNKIAGLRPSTLLKERLQHRCFPVNFAKFLRTPFLTEHSGGCFCRGLFRTL